MNATSPDPHFQTDKDGSLIISRAMQSYDEGMYTCKARNQLGEISAMGELQVKGTESIYIMPRPIKWACVAQWIRRWTEANMLCLDVL